MKNSDRLCAELAKVYKEAMIDSSLRASLSPRIAALETVMFVAGILRLWLLDEGVVGVRKHGRELILAHVDTRLRVTSNEANFMGAGEIMPSECAVITPAREQIDRR